MKEEKKLAKGKSVEEKSSTEARTPKIEKDTKQTLIAIALEVLLCFWIVFAPLAMPTPLYIIGIVVMVAAAGILMFKAIWKK